jgi:enoyl-CoA hydratase/carnithine racemase
MRYQNITCDKQDHISILTLGPEASRAIDLQTAAELEDACRSIRQDAAIRVVVLVVRGCEEVFSCDQDKATREDSAPAELSIAFHQDAPGMIAAVECPAIAAMVGNIQTTGLALSLACDLRIASEDAMFSVADITHRCLWPAGITQRLPRIVGHSRAMEILLTGAPIGAAEALHMGLVHRLAPASQVLPQATKLAHEIAAKAPIALRYVKEAIRKGADMTLDQGLRLECDLYMILQTTQDRVEGITSFRDKTPPFFRGE